MEVQYVFLMTYPTVYPSWTLDRLPVYHKTNKEIYTYGQF